MCCIYSIYKIISINVYIYFLYKVFGTDNGSGKHPNPKKIDLIK